MQSFPSYIAAVQFWSLQCNAYTKNVILDVVQYYFELIIAVQRLVIYLDAQFSAMLVSWVQHKKGQLAIINNIEEVPVKWMDRPSATEMERGCAS